MRLQACLFPLRDDSKRVLTSLLPPEALLFTSARCPVDVDDTVLARILREGDRADGFWVAGESVFSAREARGFTHFELVCRSIIKKSKADFAANDAVRAGTPLFDAGGHAPIRLLPAVTLTHIALNRTWWERSATGQPSTCSAPASRKRSPMRRWPGRHAGP